MRTVLAKDARGVSLMEAIATVGIMTIVLVMVAEIFASGQDTFLRQSARIDNEVGALLAGRAIGDATRGAVEVLASSAINGTTYTTDEDTLVLRIPAVDSSDAVLAGLYDLVAVYRDTTDTTLLKTDTEPATGSVRVAGKRTITGYNQTLVFRYNDPDPSDATRVQVYIVNTQTKKNISLTTKSWTAIFLRNR